MFFKSKPSGSIDAIVVGLGNPGEKYQNTRHNMGFCAVDYITDRLGISLSKLKFEGLYAQTLVKDKKVIFIKPQTFMNESGRCISKFSEFYKVPAERIFVIFDDISLDVGKIRIRKNGSAGGHNGIKSIISHLGSQDFPRIKIGVGQKPNPEYDLVNWVLGNLPSADRQTFNSKLADIEDALFLCIGGETEKAMAKYN